MACREATPLIAAVSVGLGFMTYTMYQTTFHNTDVSLAKDMPFLRDEAAQRNHKLMKGTRKFDWQP